MRYLILILILLPSSLVGQSRRRSAHLAATIAQESFNSYYVSNTDGSADFSSVSALNSFGGLIAGDHVFFKRGDDFTNGTVVQARSGASGSPIVYSAYGTGAKPRISGISCDFDDYITIEYLDIDAENTRITTIGMYDSHYITVDSCLVGNTIEQNAIYMGPATNVTISRCVIRNTTYDATGGKNTHCMYISGSATGTNNILVEYCDISGGQTCGIQMNGNGGTSAFYIQDPILRYNRIHNNEIGIGDYSSNNAYIYGNYIYNNNGVGYYNDDAPGSIIATNGHVYNNTIYHRTEHGWDEAVSIYNGTNYEFKNNIIFDPSTRIGYGGAASGWDINYNMYQVNSSTGWNWNDFNYWKNVLGFDTQFSFTAVSDPLFVLPSLNDFSLQDPGSPAIDVGLNVGLPYNGAAPDIGAYETE